MEDFNYRAAKAADLGAFLELNRAIYGGAPPAEYFQWKYLKPLPYFPYPRLWLAEKHGRIVASGGLVVFPFWTESGESLGAPITDLKTHPEFQKQGHSQALYAKLHETFERSGVTHTFALPSDLGRRAVLTFDLKPVFPSPWLRRPVAILTALRDRSDASRRVTEVGPTDSAINTAWQRLRTKVLNCSIPTPDWLAYRYANVPGKRYQLFLAEDEEGPCGLLVSGTRHFRGKEEAVIAYLLVENDDHATLAALLSTLARHARRAGLHGIRTLIGESPAQLARWRAVHFKPTEGAFILHVRDIRGELSESIKSADTFLPCLGDHDFV